GAAAAPRSGRRAGPGGAGGGVPGGRVYPCSVSMAQRNKGVLSVMMPIYNEERTLHTILAHVLARPEVGEVIAVDDGSRDASWEILQEIAAGDKRLRPLRQASNQGKGAALRRAI